MSTPTETLSMSIPPTSARVTPDDFRRGMGRLAGAVEPMALGADGDGVLIYREGRFPPLGGAATPVTAGEAAAAPT